MVNFVFMMIEKYISALLYRYQCVTVPGFGAFLAETSPARLDSTTHTFYPPKKLISFNANLKNNDGLLANHIALQENISYDEAVAALQKQTTQWLYMLEGGQPLMLKNLGQLTRNAEGSLVFTPDTPVNYLTDAFGLSAFTSPAVKREEHTTTIAITEEAEEEVPVLLTAQRRRTYPYLKYAALFAVAFTAAGAGYKTWHEQKVAEETLLVQQQVQEEVQQRIQQATFFIDNPLPAVNLTVKEEITVMPYHIVAGAYRSEENAATAVAQLKNKGYAKARAIEKNKFGLYPVIYGSYTDAAEAQNDMNTIRKNENSEAWILIKEL
jgi:hypothetical protein